VAKGNSNSIKLLENIRMKHEEIQRKILPIRGKWIGDFSYAILEVDFLEENP
jgi:RimJ/RimL family protein N-acetyltransferase